MGCDIVIRREGLDEVVELCAVSFVEAFFGNRVFRHANRFADCFVAGPALARFPIGTAE